MNNNIIIFGGDGFVGWPTSLYLSSVGYDVIIVDNLSRRKIDIDLGCQSLTPIASIEKRIEAWEEVSGKRIRFECFDMKEHYHRLLTLIEETKPKAVVHFAEQRSAPYCLTPDVEVLTDTGFKTYDRIKADDKIATIDFNNECLEYQSYEDINVFDYSGELIEFKRSSNFSLLCTPDHDFIHRQKIKNINKWKYIKSKAKNRKFINSPCTFSMLDVEDSNIKDYWFSLAGWILSEGCFSYNRNSLTISVYQSKHKNFKKCKEIEEIFDATGLKYYIYEQKNCNTYRFANSEVEKICKMIPEKYNIPDYIFRGSYKQKKIFLDAFINGDGHVRKDGRRHLYFGKDRKMFADQFQKLLTEMGIPSVLLYDKNEYGKWVINIKKTKHVVATREKNKKYYDGVVWCPTTKNGNWVCRNNGVVFVTGNSMKSPYHKRYTVDNNINATNNVLCAVVESGLDVHVVHLGSTGIYGYGTAGMAIPEGYLPIKVQTDEDEKELEIMYPMNAGSIYHMSKCMDVEMFRYYNKNDGVRITDLEQGIVWGTQTNETKLDERLINRFDYEGDYGTVLNRFLMQAAVGHPLTVHGTGGQTRAFIHIKDTVKCVRMAIENPPQKGERVKIFNQTSECLNINDLALKIRDMFGAEVRYYKNPRNEDVKNDLEFVNEGFKSLGWQPILLDDGLMTEVEDIAKKYKDRCDQSKIICTSVWSKEKEIDLEGSDKPVE